MNGHKTETATDVKVTTNGTANNNNVKKNAAPAPVVKKEAIVKEEAVVPVVVPEVKDDVVDVTNESQDESDLMEIIQDVGFTVQIISPGIEPLSIQVSSMELVQEIHQLLMDREDTCHRTCFSLQLDGVTLDNFAELKNIDGLQEGSIIKVAEEPYTMREARIHVRHVRDLLKSMDPADAYNGVDCSSLTFLHTITQGMFKQFNCLIRKFFSILLLLYFYLF